MLEYHNRVKDASAKSDRMICSHENAADDINRIALSLYTLGTQDSTDLCKFFLKVSELFEKTRDLLYRRSRALLIDFKMRRVSAFRKNLVELAELELKHAKGNLQLLQSCMGDTPPPQAPPHPLTEGRRRREREQEVTLLFLRENRKSPSSSSLTITCSL
ncbi:hypothetical protein F7725_007547, partial [Dissostichus mawsoni]